MKGWKKLAVGLVALILLIVIASLFIDEPLRVYLEQKMNHSLKGYTVRIERLHFHPIGFALDLENLELAGSAYGEYSTMDGKPSVEGLALRTVGEQPIYRASDLPDDPNACQAGGRR